MIKDLHIVLFSLSKKHERNSSSQLSKSRYKKTSGLQLTVINKNNVLLINCCQVDSWQQESSARNVRVTSKMLILITSPATAATAQTRAMLC